ncbi:MAG: radical SAM protein [Dethiobacteria bacterium]
MDNKKMSLEDLLEQAWKVRQAFFPDQIEFAAPNRTLSVSVTGGSCELNCSHCNGVYLQKMIPIEQALSLKDSREKSYLVSGGCNAAGKVPLLEKWSELEELASRGALNLHTGLVTDEEASRLSEIATVVSFDFVGDDETISAVYGIPVTVNDYLSSYRSLQKYTRVIPHICIGLKGGEIKGEYEALKILRDEAVEAISMIVFRPTAETRFSECSPPAFEDAARFIASARLMFPRTPLYLGCMRPGGRYRAQLDALAIKAGVNKIVLPAPEARRQADELGLSITVSGECCSL